MKKYILALDQGTTSSRAVLFDRSGRIRTMAQKEFQQFYPNPGWVEHDPAEIWTSQLAVAREALAAIEVAEGDIAAIGITNQRETTVVWDKQTGKPVCNAIVWQDRRTADLCDSLKSDGWGEKIREMTGLVIDAYFSATKLKWILDNISGTRRKAEAGNLAFGTIDSWLIWNLTGGEKHVTDASNASRTMLYNIHENEWDHDLLALFEIPENVLPDVRSSSEVFGETSPGLLADASVPIAGVAGDQQAALFGQMCTEPGMLKNTYGTGCFMMLNTGHEAICSRNNLLTTIAWRLGEETVYALEGSIFIAGAVVQWLRDEIGLIKSSAEVEELAKTVQDNGGVYLVPAFAGLGAPHWDQFARGTILGLTRGTNAGHLARAALEGIAFQTMDVLKAMQADSGIDITELRVDGGATSNNLLMQFQADILDVPLIRPAVLETTALGAAYWAGLAVDFWHDVDEIRGQWRAEHTFEPGMSRDKVEEFTRDWQSAVGRAKDWIKPERGRDESQ